MLRVSGVCTLSMGIVMLTVWIILLAQGQVRELTTAPIQGMFLLFAEILIAAVMMLGGIGLVTGRCWGKSLNFAALGTMLYTSVNSIGVFGQDGTIPAALFFVVLSILTAYLLVKLIRMEARRETH